MTTVPVQPSDEAILQYERQLKEETVMKDPLVGDFKDFNALEAEYISGAEAFRHKIQQLKTSHAGMRTIRRDGNCFYRAFSFRLCEIIISLQPTDAWRGFLVKKLQDTRSLLVQAGYDPIITEDFYEPLVEMLDACKTVDELLDKFRTEHISDTIVCYLRLVTAAMLKVNHELYEGFILDSFPSLEAFIASQVEPMGVESDQIHIVAIVNATGLRVWVENLDLSNTTDFSLNHHEITPMDTSDSPGTPSPPMTLLFRPGHYDLVY